MGLALDMLLGNTRRWGIGIFYGLLRIDRGREGPQAVQKWHAWVLVVKRTCDYMLEDGLMHVYIDFRRMHASERVGLHMVCCVKTTCVG